MYSNQLSDFNKLKEHKYYLGYHAIDNNKKVIDKLFPLDSADVFDTMIVWNINDMSVEGYVLFQDSVKLLEILPPHSSMFFRIEATDFTGVTFKHSFVITRITKEIQNVNNPIIKLEFIDEYYYSMSNTYISKAYSKSTFSSALKSIIEKDIKSNIFYEKPCHFSNTTTVYPSLVVPGNKSIISFLYQRELLDDCLFFQTRNNLVLINSNEVYSNAVKLKDTLVFVSSNADIGNPFEIRGLKILYMDKLNYNTFLPNSAVYESDPTTKSIYKTLVDVGTCKSIIGDSSTLLQLNSTSGVKNVDSSINVYSRLYNIKLNEIAVVELDVNGSFMYNLLFNVSLNVGSNIESFKKYMPYINGEYTITKIIDRMEKGHFTQKLILSRPGYSKG
jgi:hypothetical protein